MKLTFSENYYQKLKMFFSTFILNNTDVLGDSILFSELTSNTTCTTEQN